MSNTIDWGQAAINNTLGFGQAAKNSTLGFGEIEATSWSGETNITGTPSTPSFSNTKSIALDGVDDFVNINNSSSLQITGALSLSAWVKTTDTNYISIYGKGNSVAQADTHVRMQNTGVIRAFLNNNAISVTGTTAINDGNWHHVMFVYVPSTSMTIYVDGSQDAQNTTSIPSAINNNYSNVYISQFQKWLGNIDEVAVWDSEINISDVWDGSGVPFDISSTNPLSWWRCGDGDTSPTLTDNGSGGNDGTMTNFSTFSTDVPTIPFSTRSIALDGVDDFVTMGNVLNMADDGTDSFSCSFWMKRNSFSTEMIVSKQLNSGSYNGFAIYIVQGRLTFFIGSGTSPDSKISGRSTNYVIGSTWNNVILTYDGSQDISGFNIYINGVSDSVVTLSNNTPTKVSNTTDFRLSGRGGGTALVYGGGLDEVAFWNGTELTSTQANEIGGTIPTDLSTYNPTSWYRCGDGDTAPTLTDNGSGGNDGTMTNFTTFSTDVPT